MSYEAKVINISNSSPFIEVLGHQLYQGQEIHWHAYKHTGTKDQEIGSVFEELVAEVVVSLIVQLNEHVDHVSDKLDYHNDI